MTNKEVLFCPQPTGVAQACPKTPAAPVIFASWGGSNHEWDYMHHVPGRLRVRAASLHRNRDRAAAIEVAVNAIEGVSAAAVNLLTGSLTIIYEPNRVTPEVILGVLRCHGFTASPTRGNSTHTTLRGDAAARKASRAVLYLVLEHMVERSVKVALTALL